MSEYMYRFFCDTDEETVRVTGEDAHHISNVLRMEKGEQIIACCGDGLDYIAEITNIAKDCVTANVIKTEPSKGESNIKITLFQGLPKGEKFDTVIQKSVELGVFEIVPIMLKRCVVKIDSKKKSAKTERWNKITLSAAKQCGRGIVPQVKEPLDIKEAALLMKNFDLVIVAYEEEKETTLKDVLTSCGDVKNIAVVIGPEGGIEKEELNYLVETANGKSVTLGERILRTETAPISLISMIMYHFM